MDIFMIAVIAFTLINTAILALNLKIYTELMKDRNMERRFK